MVKIFFAPLSIMGTSTRKRMEIMKRFASTLLTISTVLISSTSIAFANPNIESGSPSNSNEWGSVQDADQRTMITGDDNGSIQTSKQMNRMERRSSNGARGVNVQGARQNSDVWGNRNFSGQDNEQSNEINDSDPMSQDPRSFEHRR
jgi:hypothetical protein